MGWTVRNVQIEVIQKEEASVMIEMKVLSPCILSLKSY